MADEHNKAGILVEEGDQPVLFNVLPQAGLPVKLTPGQAGIWECFLMSTIHEVQSILHEIMSIFEIFFVNYSFLKGVDKPGLKIHHDR